MVTRRVPGKSYPPAKWSCPIQGCEQVKKGTSRPPICPVHFAMMIGSRGNDESEEAAPVVDGDEFDARRRAISEARREAQP